MPGGMISDFKEKSNYKPDIKIKYADEHGRILGPKEAFKQLSYRFHGKGSGKKKTEKRMKKLQEENVSLTILAGWEGAEREIFFHSCSGPRYSSTLVPVQDVPKPNPNLNTNPNPDPNANPNPNINPNPNPDSNSWTGTSVEKIR